MFKTTNQNNGTLYAPPGYWNLNQEQYKKICNGVGPRGWGWVFPETIWGMKITAEADVHDFCYFQQYEFEYSNKLFYENVKRSINKKGGLLKWPRRARNKIYYGLLQGLGKFFY